MAVPRVCVTRQIPQAGIDLIVAEGFELQYNSEDRPLAREELLDYLSGVDGAVTMLHDRVDAEAIDAAVGIKVFSNYAVGFNNIDLETCRARGIRVTNTPEVLTDATADTAMTLLLATARRVVETDRFLRAGKWNGWSPMLFLGADVSGRTLGIIGPGRIGAATAERAAFGFKMKVLYTCGDAPPPPEEWEKSVGARHVDLDTLLAESDFVSIHCPLDENTNHLIGERELAQMKSSAILINTARGPIVDEAALVEALKTGKIAGAGLDVFEEEPAIVPGLVDLPNTVLLPHLGSATVQTRADMATLAARNLIAVIRGEEPPRAVV